MKRAKIQQDLYRLEHELMDFGIYMDFLLTYPSYNDQIAYIDRKMKEFEEKIDTCKHILEELDSES